jgi:hypothetical protein
VVPATGTGDLTEEDRMKRFRIIEAGNIVGEGVVFSNGVVAYSRTTPDMKWPHADMCSTMAEFQERHLRWDVSYLDR